jgi:peroxiredoxin
MTKFSAALLAAPLAVLSLAATAFAGPQIGQPAPGFSGVDASGAPVKLADFRGRTVVLEWTNHECPYVKKHYTGGNMQATQTAATGQGVVWLSVISSAPGKQGAVTGEVAAQLTASRGAKPKAVILDPTGAIGRAYEAKTTPHMFVIDGQGIVRYMGAIDDKPSAAPETLTGATNYVLAALKDLGAGQPVKTPETEPYGCTVKY